MADPFKPTRQFKAQPSNKSKGILDDHAVRKSMLTREGSITKTPVADIDIANKKYVDDENDLQTLQVVTDAGATTTNAIETRAHTIKSTDGSDSIVVYHDNTNANLNFNDGILNIMTTEAGLNKSTSVLIKAATGGVGRAALNLDRGNGTKSLQFSSDGFIDMIGGGLQFNFGATQDVNCFAGSTEGETVDLVIFGRRTGDTQRNLRIGISADEDDTALFDNVGNYHFSGNIKNDKIKMTSIGGQAIKLTNKTGANSVQGEVVRASAANDDAVILAVAGELNPIGVFLDSGVTDGSEAWIVVSGIAEVLADTAGFTRGDRLITSALGAPIARATTNNAPAVAVHFQEIGHALETSGANALGRCVLHFL